MDHVTSQVGPILKIWNFRLHNGILHPKISLNAKFQLFIPFNREVINIWLILGVFWAKWTTWRHRWPNFEDLKPFDYTIRILTGLNAKFQLFIPFNREVIHLTNFRILPRDVTGGPSILKIWNFWLHNRILHPKISLNAKFLFIPFNREVINIWLILGVFWA